ncbi:AraC family transcriptional regulator [Galbibacter sp.]|jgi:AraC-like DNA-binding protein|uniref:AraC family transcriptional regulator n=1 Tax=Galbibacter sp. TaxID=2918471 RepID=UPI003A9506CF
MKLHFLDRTNSQLNSFSITRNRHPHFLKVWHYHPELELVIILQSTGTRFIGDSIERFEKGDVVLIGANLPHMWMNDELYFSKNSELYADAISIHFRQDFLGESFINAFEMKPIKELMQRAALGICFSKLEERTVSQFKSLAEDTVLTPLDKTLTLLNVLGQLSNHSDYKILSSAGFKNSFDKVDNGNLKKIYEFIFENFSHPISAKDVAEVVHMNTAAFSRFFKRIHRKTFTSYLNEIRIGYACKLLIEKKQKVISICYECGFNNISNFNRQFKLIKGMTPTEFVHKHIT